MGSGRVADGTIFSTVGLEVGFDGGLMVLGLSNGTFSWPPSWCLKGHTVAPPALVPPLPGSQHSEYK